MIFSNISGHIPDIQATLRRQAKISAIGITAIFTLGIFTLIALCLAAFWLLVLFLGLVVASCVEVFSYIGTTFQTADPSIRLIVLVLIGYVLYRVVCKLRRTK